MIYSTANNAFEAAVQPPLQSVLVRDETIPIVTCTPSRCYGDRDGWIVGNDADPEALAKSWRKWIIQRTSEKIISVNTKDTQQYLWSDTPYWLPETKYSSALSRDRGNFEWALGLETLNDDDEPEPLFFASSVPNGFDRDTPTTRSQNGFQGYVYRGPFKPQRL